MTQQMKKTDKLIILSGCDGVGKTSLVQFMNKNTEYNVIERSNAIIDDVDYSKLLQVNFLDQQTLKYTFEERDNLQEKLSLNHNIDIYWIVLYADHKVLLDRISKRDSSDLWETPKALFYYNQRYRELSSFYGLPLIDTSNKKIEEISDYIKELIGIYPYIRKTSLQNIDKNLSKYDIENKIELKDIPKIEYDLFDPRFDTDIEKNYYIKHKLAVRHLVNNTQITYSFDNIAFNKVNVQTDYQELLLLLVKEGESKRVYRVLYPHKYFDNMYLIQLKSTIYSHSKQSTGYIEDLAKIRAEGTQLMLEMMWRNTLNHSYRSINNNGIIISDKVEITPLEIIIKKYCEGTDKHSYYVIKNNEKIVLETGEYAIGPYVRFDWRNPNHTELKSGRSISENCHYYILEEFYGKETFYNSFIRDNKLIKPFGDKVISPEILENLVNKEETIKSTLKVYACLQNYLNKINLEIYDGCFMIDSAGKVFWSEINQDCFRFKSISNNQDSYDKDLWRSGGASVNSKEEIKKKWGVFNNILKDYFNKNKFHNNLDKFTEYEYKTEIKKILSDQRLKITDHYKQIYRELLNNKSTRRVMVTMDLYNNQPFLVQKGVLHENHSHGLIMEAFNKISIFPDILVVDLNGAFGEKLNNREIIKKLAHEYYIHTGGGIRDINTVQELLKSSVRRIVISSNTSSEFIKQIPKDRLIIELSVDQKNNILIKGRTENTQVNIIDKIKELVELGVNAISITFHHTEGLLNGLPRSQISDLIPFIPKSIKKIFIAGGVSSIDDMEFLWNFDRVIPQLGSAIWKNKISIGDIYSAITNYAVTPAIIQDIHGVNKGLIYMNPESLKKTCDTRKLYRYSRQYGRVMLKGESSGDVQKVIKISQDCDSDSLLIIVDANNKFCHNGNYSCFSNQTVIKANMNTLSEYIKENKNKQTYSGKMQTNPDLALAKLMEEFWEIVCASSKTMQVHECADFLVHFIMYINGKNINVEDVLNELNARRWDPKLSVNKDQKENKTNKIIIAVTPDKYSNKTDGFLLEKLGVEIVRPKGRDLKVNYNITDHEKYDKVFKDKELVLVGTRPKDIPWLISFGTIDGAVTYNTVMDNHPKVCNLIIDMPDNTLSLALIKRKGDVIDQTKWTEKKVSIACEHVKTVYEYFMKNNIPEDCFTLDRIVGSSESYMVNNTKANYLLCDAVVETGKTLDENNLEVWKTVLNKGDVKIGLYMKI
jgi:phosphoribosylformimino-5-aminoimidazole carboxamide ribonucleotide (ProFAR) isomerase/phosphoribosyl-ATP pyrophosphohydrolase/broad-specificity NMP kinase